MRKISINNVATRAGVSISTVSFVLNDKAAKMRISVGTIERVYTAARELGYQPSAAAIAVKRLNNDKTEEKHCVQFGDWIAESDGIQKTGDLLSPWETPTERLNTAELYQRYKDDPHTFIHQNT